MTEQNHNKKNIVFDLDGTILDSHLRHVLVLVDSINQINDTRYSADDFYDFISYKSEGNTGLAYLQNKEIPNAKEIYILWKKKIEYKKYLKTDILYPNVCESLGILNTQYNLFLITARANKKNANWQLMNLNIDGFFKKIFVVSNANDVGYNKYMAVKLLPVTYVIGDTEIDYDFAKRVNSSFFPLNCGFRTATFWEKRIEKSYNSIHEILPQITNNYK